MKTTDPEVILTPALLYTAAEAAKEFPTDNCKYRWVSKGYE